MKNTLLPPRLAAIPPEHYDEYRLRTIFDAYKWDPQVGDRNTLSHHAVMLAPDTAQQLSDWAEQLSRETVRLENALHADPKAAKTLSLSPRLLRELRKSDVSPSERNLRLMRFDFHPTTDGWAVSEVNSDVPGGLAEASILPHLAAQYFPNAQPAVSFADVFTDALSAKAERGRIALIHATAYSDDRQVMQFLGDRLQAVGFEPIFAAPDHITWSDRRAFCELDGKRVALNALIRFFPLEWLTNLPRNTAWQGFFDTVTPSCNHPVAIYAQSKRLPFVWDALGVYAPTWRQLLPQTVDVRNVDRDDERWVLKPAFGRVGEGIAIRGAVSDKEFAKIKKAAKRSPKHWIAQRKFDSLPLLTEDGTERHLCIGAFTVDSRFAGFYGRISLHRRIDASAQDVPILVEAQAH